MNIQTVQTYFSSLFPTNRMIFSWSQPIDEYTPNQLIQFTPKFFVFTGWLSAFSMLIFHSCALLLAQKKKKKLLFYRFSLPWSPPWWLCLYEWLEHLTLCIELCVVTVFFCLVVVRNANNVYMCTLMVPWLSLLSCSTSFLTTLFSFPYAPSWRVQCEVGVLEARI